MVMMDQKEKESLSDESGDSNKCCTDCKTTKTPLWRGGPAGPKTLCNACGIRYRKRRASSVRSNKAKADGFNGNNHLKESSERKMIGLGGEESVGGHLKTQRWLRKRKLGEVEEAAFCLMALSCGFVFA